MLRQKVTNVRVDSVGAPKYGQAFLRDTELRGFALRVSAKGVKSFVLEKCIRGRNTRLTIGHYPDLTVEQARAEAQNLLGSIALAVPLRDAPPDTPAQITLGEVFRD